MDIKEKNIKIAEFKTIEKALLWLEKESIKIQKDKFAFFNWDFHFSNHPGATQEIDYGFYIRTSRMDYYGNKETPLEAINEAVKKYIQSLNKEA